MNTAGNFGFYNFSQSDVNYNRLEEIDCYTNCGSLQNDPVVDVPEPSTLAIFTLGLIGLASRRFKKKA